MKKYFKLEEAMSSPHKFLIMPIHENLKKFFKLPIEGSYGLLPSRLLNLSYAQYCRFCRDILGAEIVGKDAKYMLVYFQKTEEVQLLVRLLNRRMEYLEHEYDNPYDYKEDGLKIERIPWEIN